MKYIIFESRLLSVIYKFLDKKIPDPIEIDHLIYWGKPEDSDLLLDIKNKLLLIRMSLSGSVSDVFGISERESIRIITKYLKNKGFEIDRVV